MPQEDHPYSLPLAVRTIPAAGKHLVLKPSPQECAAIAAFLDINGVEDLEATLTIVPWRDKGIKATGKLQAKALLTCVLSHEVFAHTVAEDILMVFSEEAANAHDENIDFDTLMDDNEEAIIDPIVNGQIDAGHIITEFLALGLPPFPRKPDVESPLQNEETVIKEAEKPFAVLSQLFKEKN